MVGLVIEDETGAAGAKAADGAIEAAESEAGAAIHRNKRHPIQSN